MDVTLPGRNIEKIEGELQCPGKWSDMDKQEQLEELKANARKIRFTRLCQIAEAFGFETRKGTGSHRVYFREGIWEILNFQNVEGWAKAYQVRQFIKVIEKYNLQED